MISNQLMSVNEINAHIKNLLQGDSLLRSVWIKGEISNFKYHSSGHIYFSLKDEHSAIKCVMFKSHAQKLTFRPEHGMQVIVSGYISVYERDGVYQLYVEDMLMAGAGLLHIAYEKLKQKLMDEGLFATDKKRPLPYFPKAIGIVTSPTGAALRDILSIIKRRNSLIPIFIAPAVVQGADGVDSICRALTELYRSEVDVIIVGRGGGSLEELWCFNEERVVRQIAASPVPIISAVGHETDFTLADFAADARAATPSMAAELVTPPLEALHANVLQLRARLGTTYERQLTQKRQKLALLIRGTVLADPQRFLQNYQQQIDDLAEQLTCQINNRFTAERSRLQWDTGRLDALSPLKVLGRGYAVCENTAGEVIKNSRQIENTEHVKIILQAGSLSCIVQSKEEEDNG